MSHLPRERGTALGQNDLVDSPKIPASFRSIVYVPVSGDGPPVSLPSEEPRAISICCPDTGDRCTIEDGPSVRDFAAGIWKYVCPSCGEEHQQRYGRATLDDPYYRRTIDIPLDLDLGELVRGQHIVLRGIQLRTTSGSVLHYRFVPGFDRDDHELDTSWGLGKVTDDLGSEYDHSGAGGWGADSDGIVRNGDEDLGRGIPNTARWVEIEFRPAHSQQVAGSQVLKIRLDMLSKSIYEVMATDT
jgi:hypothetical protein